MEHLTRLEQLEELARDGKACLQMTEMIMNNKKKKKMYFEEEIENVYILGLEKLMYEFIEQKNIPVDGRFWVEKFIEFAKNKNRR